MTPKIIPFEPEHLATMIGHHAVESDKKALEALGQAHVYLQLGPCYSIIVGDEIIWCGGLVVLWPGVAEAWAVPSWAVADYPLTVHRAVKQTLARLIQTLNLRRIQCSVVREYLQSRNWVKRLGFCFEGKMKNYGPDGATHYRFSWVK